MGRITKKKDSLIKTVWQRNKDVKMEFGILNCAVVSLQRGNKTRWEGIRVPNGEEKVKQMLNDKNI